MNERITASTNDLEMLLVEDDADARALTEHFAATLGYRLQSVDRASAALEAFERHPFEIVLVDWSLPGIDGLEFIQRLRGLPGGSSAYVIMLTARGGMEDVRKAIRQGVNDYLPKPFDLQAFTIRLLLADRSIGQPATDAGDVIAGHDRRAEQIERLLKVEIERRTQTETLLRRTERVYRSLAQNMPGGMLVFDRDLRYTVAEPKLPGLNSKDVEGRTVREVFGTTLPQLEAAYLSVLEGHHSEFEQELDGRFFHVQTVPIRDDSGNVQGGLHLSQDITQARLDLERLRESEERYELAARGTNDGIWDWDLRTDLVYYSVRWQTITGSAVGTRQATGPDFWFSRIHPDDRARVSSELKMHLSDHSNQFLTEHRLIHDSGDILWVLVRGVALRDDDGKAYRIAGSITDITTQKRMEESLMSNALYDSLTKLPNQALLLDRLKSAYDRASRNPHYLFAVVSLELDRFELITESLRGEKVEELLHSIVERLADRLRSSDTLARIGESKFAILLDDVANHEEAKELFNNIQDEVSMPFVIGGSDLFVGANMGIAFSDAEHEEADELLRSAELARYHARESGSSGYEIYREFMQSHMRIRMKLETQLRIALQNMDFELHYQPIVSLSAGAVVGVEALLRWEHPELGFISPAQFVPIAEETGMIRAIGEWALRTACLQSRSWQDDGLGELYTAVNLSARQFHEEDLIELAKSAISQARMVPELLVLELTESTAMKDHDYAMSVLRELRNLGFRVAIDDFGTGYSSLAYLKDMPADTLKIDRSFLADVPADAESSAIVAAIIQLGRGLKRKIVAEGVETSEQLAFLHSAGCDLIQGFYFSKPLPAAEVSAFIRDRKALAHRISEARHHQ